MKCTLYFRSNCGTASNELYHPAQASVSVADPELAPGPQNLNTPTSWLMGPLRVTPVADLGGAGGASRDTESNYGGENADSALVSARTESLP